LTGSGYTQKVCGYDAEGDSRVVTELIRRVRKKLAEYTQTEYIETVLGDGVSMEKIRNLSLKKTMVLYTILSLIVTFFSFCVNY